MKNEEKKGIVILIVASILLIVITVFLTRGKKRQEVNPENENTEVQGELVYQLEDGTKLNKSDKLKDKKEFDGLEITNFQITEKKNVTVLLGTITNNTNEVHGGYPVKIIVLDKQGNEIITVGGYIKELKPGESTQLNSSTTFDYANAYDFKIEKK